MGGAASGADGPLELASLSFEWDLTGDHRHIPKRFQVQVSPDGVDWKQVCDLRAGTGPQLVSLRGWTGPHIRVLMEGHAPANVTTTHSLGKVRVWVVDQGSLYVSGKATVDDLFAWMVEVLHSRWPLGSPIPSLGPSGGAGVLLRGLQSIVRTSGSMVSLLALVQELLGRGGEPVDPASPLHRTSGALVSQVLQLADTERQARCRGSAQASGSTSTSFGELPAAFDDDVAAVVGNGTLTFRENNTVVESTSGSHAVCLLTHGGFTTGKARWEFRLEEDTNSQCVCFGAAIKPVRNCNYEKSKELWMYRAYNGYRYTLGACNSSTMAKVNKGDTIRLELDMDEGTMRVVVNEADQGVCFTGMQGYEVWPAIQFYSSGRIVRVLKLEGPRSLEGPVVDRSYLCDQIETSVSVGHGMFGKYGDLGYNEGSNRKILVNGAACLQGISMHPPVNQDGKSFASASYSLAKKFERLVGSVAINDDVAPEKLREGGSPVTFQLWGDGSLLWCSEPVSAPKATQAFDVSLLRVDHLELRVQARDKNQHCHAVWVDPMLTPCSDWLCNGWRNDKDTFVCALSGCERGQVPPLPALEVDSGSLGGVAASLLSAASVLADEVTAAMQSATPSSPEGDSTFDLEAPMCVEVSESGSRLLAAVLGQVSPSGPLVDAVLRLVRANLRRLVVSNVQPVSVVGDAGLASLLEAVNAVLASDAASSGTKALAADVLHAGQPVFFPTVDARVARWTSLCPGAGVVEFQVNFPSQESSLDTVVILLQLLCRQQGWAHRLVGRWPAKLYLVMEVPHVLDFFTTHVRECFARAGVTGWAFPDGAPELGVDVKLEVGTALDRASRLTTEHGVGVFRSFVLPESEQPEAFSKVVASLLSFLPAATA